MVKHKICCKECGALLIPDQGNFEYVVIANEKGTAFVIGLRCLICDNKQQEDSLWEIQENDQC